MNIKDFTGASLRASELLKTISGKRLDIYRLSLRDINDELLKLETTLEKVDFLKEILKEAIQYGIDLRREIDKKYSAEEQVNLIFPEEVGINELEKSINELLVKYKNIAELENEPVQRSINAKIHWNGQKNSLIDLFYQLKRLTNDKNEPLLANSNEDLAVFLKENFSCFNETKLSTILLQLKTSQRPMKSEKRIIVSM